MDKDEDLIGVKKLGRGRKEVLNVIIADKEALTDSYMSFLRNGGLFIQTSQEYRLGRGGACVAEIVRPAQKATSCGKGSVGHSPRPTG